MLNLNKPILSICLSCRYNLEDAKQIRAGKQFSENVLDQIKINRFTSLNVRGVNCMSQCKRSCIISLTAKNSFTYIFGDIKPSKQDYVKSLLNLISIYSNSEDGFLKRSERPDLYQSNILARLPPIGSKSALVNYLHKG